jgi:hypothetical protein
MKLSPEIRKITDRMAPGVLTRDGFLGTDHRSLPEILDDDSNQVDRLGLTHERIAAELDRVLRRAMEHYGTPVQVRQGLEAVYIEAMGRIPCPFGDGTMCSKGQVDITEASTGRKLSVTALSIHMIAAHGFYQGRGSAYRVEPSVAAEMLGIASSDSSEI